MTPVLYGTIWAALGLLAAGEIALAIGRGPRTAARLHAAGAALALVHVVVAMGAVHGWRHDAAVRATAAETARVFGLDWGGGVWANYLFVAVWWGYAWRLTAAAGIEERAWTWGFRAFVLIMVANGAVVFAAAPRRAIGAAIVAALLWSWWRQARRSRSSWKNGVV